jgi:hypothetical protein
MRTAPPICSFKKIYAQHLEHKVTAPTLHTTWPSSSLQIHRSQLGHCHPNQLPESSRPLPHLSASPQDLSSHVATAIQTPPWFGAIVSTKIGQVNLNTPEKGKKSSTIEGKSEDHQGSAICQQSSRNLLVVLCFPMIFPGYANRQNLVTHGSGIQQYSP